MIVRADVFMAGLFYADKEGVTNPNFIIFVSSSRQQRTFQFEIDEFRSFREEFQCFISRRKEYPLPIEGYIEYVIPGLCDSLCIIFALYSGSTVLSQKRMIKDFCSIFQRIQNY